MARRKINLRRGFKGVDVALQHHRQNRCTPVKKRGDKRKRREEEENSFADTGQCIGTVTTLNVKSQNYRLSKQQKNKKRGGLLIPAKGGNKTSSSDTTPGGVEHTNETRSFHSQLFKPSAIF